MTGIRVISSIDELQATIAEFRNQNFSIGFVPTMGALHEGHVSLVEHSTNSCDITIVSIFVNPTQFNDPKDLEQYPRTFDQDLKLLQSTKCQLLFTPSVEALYAPEYTPSNIELGAIDSVMEGANRPGHFRGVMNVVERFFRLINPTKAFFGRKDFQQVAVIKHMTRSLELSIEIIECPTIRETNGLAMSSRNTRLDSNGKLKALALFQALTWAKSQTGALSPAEIMSETVSRFPKGATLEYFKIVDPQSLKTLDCEWVKGATACVVAHVDGVRLIDNLELVESRTTVSTAE